MSDKSTLRTDPEHWEQRYIEGSTPWDTGKPDLHLERFLASYRPARRKILDVGCGTGTNAVWLQRQGFEVTGVDVSSTAIQRSQHRAKSAAQDCAFVVADLRSDIIATAPFQAAYDRGCFHLFEELKESAHFASCIARHLEDDALWCSVIGSTDGPPRDTGPPRRSAAAVAAAVEPYFEIVELSTCSFDEEMTPPARGWILVARKRGAP